MKGCSGQGRFEKTRPNRWWLRGAFFGGWDDALAKEGYQHCRQWRIQRPATTVSALACRAGWMTGVATARHLLRRWGQRGQVYSKSDNFVAGRTALAPPAGMEGWFRIVTRANGSGPIVIPSVRTVSRRHGVRCGSPLTPGFGFAAATEPNTRLEAGAGAVVAIARRSTFSADADWSDWRFLDRPESTVENTGRPGNAGAPDSPSLPWDFVGDLPTRKAGIGFAGDDQFRFETIEAGIDYRDTLEFARRTALTFRNLDLVRSTYRRRHPLSGGRIGCVVPADFAHLEHRPRYSRDTSFMAGFSQPILTDSVNADSVVS